MKFVLGIEYDGSHFSGWQMQKHGIRTVQECVEKAISKVANQSIRVVCAGRTDTGVHATGQVVHFECDVDRDEKAWVQGVNTYLPGDVASIWAKQVDDDFSARFAATARQYRYIILNRRVRPAILNKKVTWKHGELNVQAMHDAAQFLLGEQDFTSFRSSACQAEHAIRCVNWVKVSREGDYIYIDIEANAFLHHMVRNIVGSLMMVGRKEKSMEWIAELVQLKDRNQAGPTALADGLYMVKVSYPSNFAINYECVLPVYG